MLVFKERWEHWRFIDDKEEMKAYKKAMHDEVKKLSDKAPESLPNRN